ncbi:hypothetical protein I7I50_04578 [Histoplasma capsulatum G186AR]|uniref:Uncharacterized protein n=1 Tax=Ajellomyces capsulatus TaxID=5037 RepID=A0A8H7YMN2_AJECA|nr:hypothetical protein I7I52_05487 [Histoplasma capsulatum]QSS75443.1 hypothetical protein I7I50_04578 [Histoplasma capsulatum G186AR]
MRPTTQRNLGKGKSVAGNSSAGRTIGMGKLSIVLPSSSISKISGLPEPLIARRIPLKFGSDISKISTQKLEDLLLQKGKHFRDLCTRERG